MYLTQAQLMKLLKDNGFTKVMQGDTEFDTSAAYNNAITYEVDKALLAQASVMPDCFAEWLSATLDKLGKIITPNKLYIMFLLDLKYGVLSPELYEYQKTHLADIYNAIGNGYVKDSEVNPIYYYISVPYQVYKSMVTTTTVKDNILPNESPVETTTTTAVPNNTHFYLTLDTDSGLAYLQKSKIVVTNQINQYTLDQVKQWFPDYVPFIKEVKQDDIDFPIADYTTTTTTQSTSTTTLAPTTTSTTTEYIVARGYNGQYPNHVNVYPYYSPTTTTTTTIKHINEPNNMSTSELNDLNGWANDTWS